MLSLRVYGVEVKASRELRPGETVIVRVTARPRGLAWPVVATLVAVAGVVATMHFWIAARHWAALVTAVVIVPPSAVLGARLWRARSHKITVTSERVLASSGVARRHQASVLLRDVIAVHTEQSTLERLTRRGIVILDTPHGSLSLERCRRPDALARVIDFQRGQMVEASYAVLDQASELEEAREFGLISDDEHDERWRHLFGWNHRP